jgi:succinate dehydrogenase/fumarate reductase flavoprotein subunit
MLACALASVHAGLARKESRSPFFRTDYPRMDHENFLCYLWTSMDKNWKFTVEKGDIVDTVLPRGEIKKALNDKDPRFDISIPNK